MGTKFLFWNPLCSEKDKSNRYNPLDLVNLDNENVVDDIQRIAHLLMHDGISENEAYIDDAKNLFTSIILYLCANGAKTKYIWRNCKDACQWIGLRAS